MILFVDNEHASTYQKPKTEWLLAARTRITYRLQDLTGQVCLLQRYPDVSPALVREYDIKAVFISGSGANPGDYSPDEQRGLRSIVESGSVPVFGFCGGFQFMGDALGAPLERVGRLGVGEDDPRPDYQPGWRKEIGYEPVELVDAHPLQDGLGSAPVFRHAHTWELKSLPDGFTNLARTAVSEHQLMAHETLPLAGSQFHPEYWTDEHPDGRLLIENFCRWAGVM